jgi:hypothetical protein
MIAVYRHDAHKLSGESHVHAREELHGVPVNQSLPGRVDGDAAALSRPRGQDDLTVPTHDTHYRLSLLTGETAYDPATFSRATIEDEVRRLVAVDDAHRAHDRWLATDVAGAFNESVYHPYTSLKYHTLLVAALLDNYRAGHEFGDLRLVVDPADEVVPFRTVFDGGRFALRIDGDDTDRPSARLGTRPWRSWASTWRRLPAHPLDADGDRFDMTLDANLRRIQSWSTALQYVEEYDAWRPDR